MTINIARSSKTRKEQEKGLKGRIHYCGYFYRQ
jgi:hypothetical protein